MRFGFRDGDAGWTGIDMTREPDALEPGILHLGQNTRLRSRRCRQRSGTSIPPEFNPRGGFTASLVGSGNFNDPNGNDLLLVAPANAQYTFALQWGRDPIVVNYSAAEALSGRTNGSVIVNFVQAFDKVLMLRVPKQTIDQPDLVWDGTGDANHDEVADTLWTAIALSPEGRTLVQASYNAEPFQDRVLYYNANFPPAIGRDTWIVSDVLDYTSYDDPYQVVRTNTAEADYITRIMGYFRGSVVVFKNQSIHQVQFLNTLPFSYTQHLLSASLGSVGVHIPIEVGGDVFFLSPPNGFYRLSEVIQENIIVLPVAISEQIQPVIDNINWGITATWGCSATLDNYVLFGVALGVGSRACNAILAYNTQSRQWESVPDTWRDPNFNFNALHVVNYAGVRRLFAVDYQNAVVYMMYEGVNDELISGVWSVPFKMETRGYTGQDPVAWKRFFRAKVAISTSAPLINLTALSDGFNEEKLLTPLPIEKNPVEFYTHAHKEFDPVVDDPNEPKRKDYALGVVEEFAIEDYESYPDGPLDVLTGSVPPAVENRQQSLERYVTRQNGRWQSIRVENDQGSCDVLAVSVEGNYTMDTARTAA